MGMEFLKKEKELTEGEKRDIEKLHNLNIGIDEAKSLEDLERTIENIYPNTTIYEESIGPRKPKTLSEKIQAVKNMYRDSFPESPVGKAALLTGELLYNAFEKLSK